MKELRNKERQQIKAEILNDIRRLNALFENKDAWSAVMYLKRVFAKQIRQLEDAIKNVRLDEKERMALIGEINGMEKPFVHLLNVKNFKTRLDSGEQGEAEVLDFLQNMRAKIRQRQQGGRG